MELSAINSILMTMLALAMAIIILFGFNSVLGRSSFKPRKKIRLFFIALFLITAWIILISGLSLNGQLAHFESFPPRPAFLILLPLPFVLYFSFTRTFRQLSLTTPRSWLINIQFFRVGVEIILWMMLLAGQIPVQMTFEGSNFDVLVGLTAFPVAFLCFARDNKRKNLAIAWNIFGLLLLLNILVIAVLSMPTPMRYFMNEPANTIVAEFPFALLPGVLVTIAYSMHIFSLRQLAIRRLS